MFWRGIWSMQNIMFGKLGNGAKCGTPQELREPVIQPTLGSRRTYANK